MTNETNDGADLEVEADLAEVSQDLKVLDEEIFALEQTQQHHKNHLETHQADVKHWSRKQETISDAITALNREIASDVAGSADEVVRAAMRSANQAKLKQLKDDLEKVKAELAESKKRSEIEESAISRIGTQIDAACSGINDVLIKSDKWVQTLNDRVGSRLKNQSARKEPADRIGNIQKIGGLKMIGLNQDSPKLSDISAVRLDSVELEYRITALLEHLTTRRIAEEMDTSSYLSRLEAFIDRARVRAQELIDAPIQELLTEISKRQADINRTEAVYRSVPSDLQSNALRKAVELNVLQNIEVAGKLTRKLTAVGDACRQITKRLEGFTEDLLSDENTARTKEMASYVSVVVEKNLLLKFLPLAVGAVAALGTKVALALQSSLFIVQNDGKIIFTAFIAAYFFSIALGKWYRATIMKRVHRSYKKSVKALFAENLKDYQSFRFDDSSLEPNEISKWFVKSPGRWAARFKPLTVIVVANVGIICLPLLLGVGVLLANKGYSASIFRQSNWQTYTFIGTNSLGAPCTIEKGHLAHMDQKHYYIVPFVDDPLAGIDAFQDFARRAFPEVFAHAIPMKSVNMIRTHAAANTSSVELCILEQRETRPLTTNVFNFSDALGRKSATVAAPELTKLELETQVHRAIEYMRKDTQTEELARIADALEQPRPRSESPSLVFNAVTTTNILPPSPQHEDDTKIWEYRLFLEQQEVYREADTQVLFFFPAGVRGTGNTLEGAYRRGLESYAIARREDGPYSNFLKTQMQHLISALSQWLNQKDTELSLSIEGFASLQWDTAPNAERRAELNHALAEGRRHAVVDELKNGLGPLADRVWLSGASVGNCIRLAATKRQKWADIKNFQFATPSDMIEARKLLIAATQAPQSDTLAEFARRSVVVRVGHGLAHCDFEKFVPGN